MDFNPFTLQFRGKDKGLEEDFLDHFYKHSISIFRWGFLLGIFLYGLFAFLDALAMPDLKAEFWKIRFFFVIPVIALGILFSFYKNFKRYWQSTIALIILVAAIGVFAMIVMAQESHRHSYYVGSILVMFLGMSFIRARFIWALFFGFLILCSYTLMCLFRFSLWVISFLLVLILLEELLAIPWSILQEKITT